MTSLFHLFQNKQKGKKEEMIKTNLLFAFQTKAASRNAEQDINRSSSIERTAYTLYMI
jgi:hypothetical protein